MQTIGIDLGGTQIKCGLVEDGRVLHACSCDTRKEEGYDAVVARMAALAGQFLPRAAVQAVGVATPGLIDVAGGVVSYSNNFGWENRPLARDLGARLGLPVQLANDAQCAALGEARHGAGQGCARMAMVTIGTGVGGGFVRNGRIETDGYGSLAYIFGHAVIERNGAPATAGAGAAWKPTPRPRRSRPGGPGPTASPCPPGRCSSGPVPANRRPARWWKNSLPA